MEMYCQIPLWLNSYFVILQRYINSNLNSAKVVREQENATLPDEIKESDSINSGQKVLSSLIGRVYSDNYLKFSFN